MRGNRRYIMSRSARRNVPPVDEESSIASVDTNFLRKLIQTGDTAYIDDLVGKQTTSVNIESPSSRGNSKYNSKHPRRWPYVLLGMGIMYVILILREARNTQSWWKAYMVDLKSSQSATTTDSYYTGGNSGLRGAPVLSSSKESALGQPQSSLFKSTTWQQTGSHSGGVGGNSAFGNQQLQQYQQQQPQHQQPQHQQPQHQQPQHQQPQHQQPQHQQPQHQQPQHQQQYQQPQQQQQQLQPYRQIAGGLSSGTVGGSTASNSGPSQSMMTAGTSSQSLFSNNQQKPGATSQSLFAGTAASNSNNRALGSASPGGASNPLFGGATALTGGNSNSVFGGTGAASGGSVSNSLYGGTGSTGGGEQIVVSDQYATQRQQAIPMGNNDGRKP